MPFKLYIYLGVFVTYCDSILVIQMYIRVYEKHTLFLAHLSNAKDELFAIFECLSCMVCCPSTVLVFTLLATHFFYPIFLKLAQRVRLDNILGDFNYGWGWVKR